MHMRIVLPVLAMLMLLVFQPGRAESPLAGPAGEGAIHGDVDQDGIVNIFDLLAILRQMSGKDPANEYSDLDGNGNTDIFDLLELLRLFSELKQPLEVAATVGGHWLTEPIVYSYSQYWDSTGVRDGYHIYSSREIGRAEFILDGDTLTGISGLTPALFEADPDTVQINNVEDYFEFTEPKKWEITVWDNYGKCAADSGVSQFVILYPEIGLEWHTNNVSEVITFPLVLYGAVQRFAIKARDFKTLKYFTFVVDLNPTGSESITYSDIQQLANRIMEQVVLNDSLFGENPSVFVSAAVSRQTESITNRLLMIEFGLNHETPSLVALDGNDKLLQTLGFSQLKQEIPAYNGNFYLEPEVYERYKDR